MKKSKIVPIDLPHDLTFLMEKADPAIKKALQTITDDALAQGRWNTAEDYLFDPDDLEFGAYWMYKTIYPIKKAIKHSGVEEFFAPYKRNQFDLKPEGFVTEKTYTMSAVGDLMLAKYLEVSQNRLYRGVASEIFDASFAFANLESTLSPDQPQDFELKGQGDTPKINITADEYRTLVKHQDSSFQVVNLANNHILDCGEDGIKVTIEQLEKDGIDYLGVYDTEEASNEIVVSQVGDISIGWIAHTFGINGKEVPKDKPWICDVTPFHLVREPDLTRIEKQIEAAKNTGCDLVFMSLHWGLEHEFYPHPDQLTWAHKFADLGVDAIIAHHPHVIQPVEIYNPKNREGCQVPILYSLGNLTPAYGSPATVLSLIAKLELSKGMMKGKDTVSVTGFELIPAAFMCEEESDQRYAAVISLKALNNCELSQETKHYVEKINDYADLILGRAWR